MGAEPGTLPKSPFHRTKVSGAEGLILSVINLAVEDWKRGGWSRVEAERFFEGDKYSEYLEWLGLTEGMIPKGVVLSKGNENMQKSLAVETAARFRSKELIPALEEALDNGLIPVRLQEPLRVSLAMSKDLNGPSREHGKQMLGDVCLVLLLYLNRKPKTKARAKGKDAK